MLFNFALMLLATMATSTLANEDLLNKWNINDPTFGPPTGKTFEFKYGGILDTIEPASAVVTYYGFECLQDGAETYALPYFIPSGTDNGVVRDTAINQLNDPVQTMNDMTLTFVAEPKELATSVMYTAIGEDVDGTPSTKNYISFCVRFGLGLDMGSGAGVQEINFLETQVTIDITLTGDFETESIVVAPKAKTNTTSDIIYKVAAELCSAGGAGVTGNAFNQGSVISVCVFPDQAAQDDGIIMASVDTFSWVRVVDEEDGAPILDADGNPTSENNNESNDIKQVAVDSSNNAANALTEVDTDDAAASGTKPLIKVSSVLFATFYATEGSVKASGSATMAFPTRRRLGATAATDSIGRRLEDEGIPPSPFDISASVTAATDGPAALQTAAGPAHSVGIVATIVGLVSAAMLA